MPSASSCGAPALEGARCAARDCSRRAAACEAVAMARAVQQQQLVTAAQQNGTDRRRKGQCCSGGELRAGDVRRVRRMSFDCCTCCAPATCISGHAASAACRRAVRACNARGERAGRELSHRRLLPAPAPRPASHGCAQLLQLCQRHETFGFQRAAGQGCVRDVPAKQGWLRRLSALRLSPVSAKVLRALCTALNTGSHGVVLLSL